jgi:carbon monoxide dehydrogenase subunit G
MAFEITKTFVVKAPPDAVWAFLTDPQRVARSLPGAAITEKLDEKTWLGTVTVKVGPVQSSYRGKAVFERLDPTTRTAEIVATGQDVRGKGGADMRLTSSVKELERGEVEVSAVAKVNVTGILAQMGRGMIQDVSDQMFQVLSQRMRAELEATSPPSTQAAKAAATPAGSPSSSAEALDVGSMGAKAVSRAAGRAVRRPAFWIAVAAVAVVLYLLFH